MLRLMRPPLRLPTREAHRMAVARSWDQVDSAAGTSSRLSVRRSATSSPATDLPADGAVATPTLPDRDN
jgi:hypothetical protein